MNTNKSVYLVLAIALLGASCSDDAATAGDARVDAPSIDAAVPKVYKQVEHLARPGINEALLLSNAFNAGYNATAPSFMGVPTDTLNMVVAEAKTVLKALYLGTCLLNGVAGVVDPNLGLKPAGVPCHALGGAIWVENAATGVTLTGPSMTAAQTYADRVFDQFVPDVMRVDMGVAVTPSSYETPCLDLTSKPVLCGGRFLDDDTIDTTYGYLLNGLGLTPVTGIPIPSGPAATYTQLSALTSDGVQFQANPANNKNNRTPPTAGNGAQFHPVVSGTFPYSANPL